MKYSTNVIKLSAAYYTEVRAVIYSILRASGLNRAAAYYHAFHFTGTDEAKETKAKKLEENKYISQLISDLKAAKRVPMLPHEDTPGTQTKVNNEGTKENEGKENGKVLQSLADIRAALIDVAGDIDGKDRANVLVQLAKITPDDDKPEEKRVKMYLPFNSDCKQCSLFLQKQRKK